MATRAQPRPNPPGPPPCNDPALNGFILAAQTAAQSLYASISGAAYLYSSTILLDAQVLVAQASNIGLPLVGLGALPADLRAGTAAIAKYLDYLEQPGCDPARSADCGYYAGIMAMSASTPAGMILAIANEAQPAAASLDMATSAFPPVAADLSNILSAVATAAQEANVGVYLISGYAVVGDVLASVNGLAATLTALAAQMAKNGSALYDHVLSRPC